MTATCTRCGGAYASQRSTSLYCSEKCKKASQRARRAAQSAVVVPVEFLGPVARATRSELESARALGTASGQVALVLARLIDTAGPGNGSAVAAWSKAHRECMATAVRAAPQVTDDPLSQIRARHRAKGLRPGGTC